MCSAKRHVRFTPESGHVQCNSVSPLWANSGHWVCEDCARPPLALSARRKMGTEAAADRRHRAVGTAAFGE